MAVLSESDRFHVWATYMYDKAISDSSLAMTKQELRAAVDAVDAFLESNAVAINNAIPQPARGVLTIKQKALLLMYVIGRRYVVEV